MASCACTGICSAEELLNHMQIYLKWWHPFHRHLTTVTASQSLTWMLGGCKRELCACHGTMPAERSPWIHSFLHRTSAWVGAVRGYAESAALIISLCSGISAPSPHSTLQCAPTSLGKNLHWVTHWTLVSLSVQRIVSYPRNWWRWKAKTTTETAVIGSMCLCFSHLS